MKKPMYAIYDTASAVYMQPWTALTDPQAQREFGDILQMQDHPIAKHPEHYFLCRIGTWNDATGKLEDEMNNTILTGLEATALLNQTAQQLGNGQEPIVDHEQGTKIISEFMKDQDNA